MRFSCLQLFFGDALPLPTHTHLNGSVAIKKTAHIEIA